MVYFRQIKYRRLVKYLRGVIYQISTNNVWHQDNTYWQQLCINSYILAKYRKKRTNWAIKPSYPHVRLLRFLLQNSSKLEIHVCYIYIISCVHYDSMIIYTNKWLLWQHYHSNQPYNWFPTYLVDFVTTLSPFY